MGYSAIDWILSGGGGTHRGRRPEKTEAEMGVM